MSLNHGDPLKTQSSSGRCSIRKPATGNQWYVLNIHTVLEFLNKTVTFLCVSRFDRRPGSIRLTRRNGCGDKMHTAHAVRDARYQQARRVWLTGFEPRVDLFRHVAVDLRERLQIPFRVSGRDAARVGRNRARS